MVYDIDSLQTKMIMERAPLLENPWNDEPSSTIKKRGRSVTRFFLYAATTASALLLLASLYVVDMYTSWPGGDAGHAGLPAAYRVLAENPLIDGHNDLLITIRAFYGNKLYDSDFKQKFEDGGMIGQVDLPRLDAGRVGGSFWSAFVPCPANGSDFSDANYAPFVKQTIEQLDLYNRLHTLYPKYFTPTSSYQSAIHAFSNSQLISPLGIEGLHQIGNSISTLRLYHALGVRYATLTWNCHNKYADAALVSDPKTGKTVPSTPLWHGVSDEGRKLVREMNRLGMLVDLSHVSVDTMRDVLGGNSDSDIDTSTATATGSGKHEAGLREPWSGSLAPPIFSHSSAKAICPHPRNVPDSVLHLVKRKNGLVMVNFNPDFISCRIAANETNSLPEYVDETNTLEQVVKHIVHIGDLIGYDHVGIGTDFDGIESTPRGLEDVSKFPDLVAELLKHGVSEEDAGKIVGRNLLRVWKAADEVAAQMQKDGVLPLEDHVGKIWAMDVVDGIM